MNLEDNFKKIKEEVPEVNPNLEEKIYRSVPQKKLRNPIWNKLTISICGMVLLVLACVIGPIAFHQAEQNNIKSTAVLLKDVKSPAEKPSQSLGEFYDKLNAFSAELSYQYLQDMDSTENAVLSPVSIFSALALATECSSIEAREEILNAIGMDYDLLKRNYGYFYQALNQITTDEKGKRASEFKLTNSIWLDKNSKYKEACIQNLADGFYCYSHSTDFKNSRASKYIQDFIKKQTYGLIDLNLELPPETIFVLLNTLY
ncbi:MAG: hypothetical protein K2N65_02700, partial [Anaeroplasmataceae bacterium]|nr:hypothetical protein [Anaeroplasmataceae bacterium]